jgi:PD-(D/E)XK endonuclease
MPKSSSPRRRPSASDPKTARQRELNTKRRGELSELAFVHKAASLDFGVAKPYGDSERFDFILISRDWPEGDKLWRVQVKSTATLNQGFYHINAHRRTVGRVVAYKPTEVDFLVAHIIPDDSWFIFPIQVLATCASPSFRPKNSRQKGIYEAYREAWHLLRPPQ